MTQRHLSLATSTSQGQKRPLTLVAIGSRPSGLALAFERLTAAAPLATWPRDALVAQRSGPEKELILDKPAIVGSPGPCLNLVNELDMSEPRYNQDQSLSFTKKKFRPRSMKGQT